MDWAINNNGKFHLAKSVNICEITERVHNDCESAVEIYNISEFLDTVFVLFLNVIFINLSSIFTLERSISRCGTDTACESIHSNGNC